MGGGAVAAEAPTTTGQAGDVPIQQRLAKLTTSLCLGSQERMDILVQHFLPSVHFNR